METSEPAAKKVSGSAVAAFILALLFIMNLLAGGVSSKPGIILFFNLLILALLAWFSRYAMKSARRKSNSGIKLAKFAFYAFIVIFVVDLGGTLILHKYVNSLKTFASTQTVGFFANDFAGLQANATTDLTRVLSYGSELDAMNKDFAGVGAVTKCEQSQDNDFTSVNFGPDITPSHFRVDLTGGYSIRCYGENEPFDFLVAAKHVKGGWQVSQYQYNTDISNTFNANAPINTGSGNN